MTLASMPDSQNAPFFVDLEVIRVLSNGTWQSDGQEITHEPTRRLFSRSLKHDSQGYYLEIGRETKRIEIEDTAYFIQRIDGNPEQGYSLWANDKMGDSISEKNGSEPGADKELLNPTTLSYRPGRLTCRIKRNGREEEAKFLHAAYFDLLQNLKEDGESYYIEIQGKRINLANK